MVKMESINENGFLDLAFRVWEFTAAILISIKLVQRICALLIEFCGKVMTKDDDLHNFLLSK